MSRPVGGITRTPNGPQGVLEGGVLRLLALISGLQGLDQSSGLVHCYVRNSSASTGIFLF